MTAPSTLNFRKAYYIKLGEKGAWEAESITSGRMRIGWEHIALEDMNAGLWPKIEKVLRDTWPDKKSVATRDLNRLRDITESTEDDIWITFHASKLWWARLKNGPVKRDNKANYRETLNGWHDHSLAGRMLVMSELPGKLVTTQGFRGTVCRVRDGELLKRIVEGRRSSVAEHLRTQHQTFASAVQTAIEQLHWKDYETLVDMVFRHAGWERVGVLGQQGKNYDLELARTCSP